MPEGFRRGRGDRRIRRSVRRRDGRDARGLRRLGEGRRGRLLRVEGRGGGCVRRKRRVRRGGRGRAQGRLYLAREFGRVALALVRVFREGARDCLAQRRGGRDIFGQTRRRLAHVLENDSGERRRE